MSESDIIIISSDEDSDSAKFAKKNEHVNCINATNSNSAGTSGISNSKTQNSQWDKSCFINSENNSVITTSKERDPRSSQSSSVSVKTECTSDNTTVIENNFSGSNKSDTFKKFMSIVLSTEHEEENKAKLLKKLNKYYKLANPEYIHSLEFNEFLEKGIAKINKNSVYLYFVLKEVKDCLVSNRDGLYLKKNNKGDILSSSCNSSEKNCLENIIENDEDEKKYKAVKKLTSLLRKLEKKIKELEEMEVDFSDEENSNYFKMQRFRQRYCQVYKKLCTYTNQPLNANRIGSFRKINFSETDNIELNRAIENWLNKTKQFPDFSDVYQLLGELNLSLNLKLNKEQLRMQAQVIFEKIGNMLQRRRYYDLWDSLSSFLDTDIDPAVKSPELDSLLQKNFEIGVKKEKELLRYYVEAQEKEKLQPREVPDEEANCSPVETGDEDEKEIEKIENMLNSKIYSDENGENGEQSDEESGSDDSSPRYSDSTTVKENSSNVDIQSKTIFESSELKTNPISVHNCLEIDHSYSKCEPANKCISSTTIKTAVGTSNETISNEERSIACVIPITQHIDDNPALCKLVNLEKGENEHEIENMHSLKRFTEAQDTKNFKKTKLINRCDSDSDCEVVEIISVEKAKSNNIRPLERKVYQINYAFINSNFNYNTTLWNNIFSRRNDSFSNYKITKNQRSCYILPLTDLTNVKSIMNKFVRYKDIKVKRKKRNVLDKMKFLSPISFKQLEGFHLSYNMFVISLAKNSISCALQQERGSESMKSQKESEKINENNDFQQGSNDESVRSPNNGCSGGGNGQDNSENNGNKKPFDQKKQVEDNQESEDKEDNDEEGADGSESKTPEISEIVYAVPELCDSSINTYQSQQNELNAAQIHLPLNEETVPTEEENLEKDMEVTLVNKVINKTENPNLSYKTRTSRTRASSNRKRKINENEGTQGTSRERDTSDIKAKNVSKFSNELTPTISSPKDNVDVIQVIKNKRITPVRAVQSDEEIVRNFLERSHPSISITTPKKRVVQNEPSDSVLQALERLSRLKGISTTIVKGSSKREVDEDVTVIGESLNTGTNQISKLHKTATSKTATAQGFDFLVPKIVTVQGNVSGFENVNSDDTDTEQKSYQNRQSRLSNIPGSNTTNYEEKVSDKIASIPVPRFRNVRSRSRRTPRNKTKNVECVVLD